MSQIIAMEFAQQDTSKQNRSGGELCQRKEKGEQKNIRGSCAVRHS